MDTIYQKWQDAVCTLKAGCDLTRQWFQRLLHG